MSESRHTGIAASLRRLRLIAGHTLGEALRLRLTVLLGVVAALLVLGSLWLREFNFGTAELKFIGDFGLSVIGLLGTLLAALATAQLFFSDLTGGAAACVLTWRLCWPCSRRDWVDCSGECCCGAAASWASPPRRCRSF